MNCVWITHEGGVYGEETLRCNLPEHEGTEHRDPRIGWWDADTGVRIMSAARRAELDKMTS